MSLEENNENDSGWELMDVEDIRSDKITIASLCLQQINRLNYLSSLGINACEPQKMVQIANGIIFGLAFLETMLMPELSEEYKQNAIEIKQKLFEPIQTKGDKTNLRNHIFLTESAPFYALKYSIAWYQLLTKEASNTNLYPTKSIGWEAGVGPYDRKNATKNKE